MVIFIVDSKNAFNEINWVGMIWTVRHLWPSGACFFFNCYRKWSSLVLRNINRINSFIHNTEGITQGDPLAMIAYGIWILTLINNTRWEIPDVTQPQYYDDAGDLGTFRKNWDIFWFSNTARPGTGVSPWTSQEHTDRMPGESWGQKSVWKTSLVWGVHERTLSWGLHWGRRVQTWLAERVYADVGEEYQHGQQNCGEISPWELRHSGTCNPTIMDISSTRHLGHRRRVSRSGENDSGNLFAWYFLQKDENPLPHRRRYNYDAGQ